MLYVMSDIHGEYDRYRRMLDKIGFSEDDTLYVLGDAVDRGPAPAALLQDMAARDNVYLLKGNHEATAAWILRQLNVEITRENAETQIDRQLMQAILDWQQDGGESTLRDFRRLDRAQKEDLLDYLEDTPLYAVAEAGDNTFILVHAGLGNFAPGKRLRDYTFEETACMRPDLERQYFRDSSIYIVSGHTPTLDVTGRAEIYQTHNNILIDCGAVFGGRLACLCLDTLQAYYV